MNRKSLLPAKERSVLPGRRGLLINFYYVKSFQIRSFLWSVFSRIRTEYGEIRSPNTAKYGPEITPHLDTFHAVKTLFFFLFWKVSKYEVFSGPNTGKYGPEKTQYLDTLHAVFYNAQLFLRDIFDVKAFTW